MNKKITIDVANEYLINKAYRPNAHLLYIVMHYNGNIMVCTIMVI